MSVGEDGFETIDLKSKRCDICHHEDGEPVIKCVINDEYLRSLNRESAQRLKGVVEAHEYCIKRWVEVIDRGNVWSVQSEGKTDHLSNNQNSSSSEKRKLFTLLRDLIGKSEKVHQSEQHVVRGEIYASQTEQNTNKEPYFDWSSESADSSDSNKSIEGHEHLNSYANYTYEHDTNKHDTNRDRTNRDNGSEFNADHSSTTEKDASEDDTNEDITKTQDINTYQNISQETLETMDHNSLLLIVETLQRTIEEKSRELITELQLKDSLKQRTDGQKSLIEQLVRQKCNP